MRASIKGECTCPTGLPLISSHNPLRSSSPLNCPGLHLGQQAPVDQLSSAARARAHASLTPAIDLHAAYRLCPSHLGPSSKPVAERWSMNRGGAGRSSVWRNEASLDCCQRTTRSLEAPTQHVIHRPVLWHTVLSCSGSLAVKNEPRGTNNPNQNTRQKEEAEGDVHMREEHTNTYNYLRECTHDQQ